jgi:hypothetical protein
VLEITHRRADFPKPTHDYGGLAEVDCWHVANTKIAFLKLFGENVVTVSKLVPLCFRFW